MIKPATIDSGSLAAALWAHGVHVLRLPEAPAPSELAAAEVVVALVQHAQARFRDAAPALIVARSSEAQRIRTAGERLEGADGRRFRILYTLAACLQRQWWTRLGLSLPDMQQIQDAYSAELGLTGADERHGRECMAAMEPSVVAACGESFRIFLEEMERERRFAAASRRGA